MALIFRGNPFSNIGHRAIGPGVAGSSVLPNIDTFADRGQQLQPTEGVPTPANDPNKWNLPITSVGYETPAWRSNFPDLLPQPDRVELLSFVVGPVTQPMPGWRSVFPDFLMAPVVPEPQGAVVPPAQPVRGWYPVYPDLLPQPAAPDVQGAVVPPAQPLRGWYPVYPDQLPQPVVPDAQGPVVPPHQPGRGWYPVYPDQVDALKATPELYQFIAQAYVVNVYTGDRAVPIHVPDEAPIGEIVTIQVEHDVGGVAVPFDVPPLLRVYHLTALGIQVIDLPYGVCTQYGANPSYFRNWTPVAKGIYMVEVVGIFNAQVVVGVVPLTIRAKFDPLALSNQDVLVQRNGDVP